MPPHAQRTLNMSKHNREPENEHQPNVKHQPNRQFADFFKTTDKELGKGSFGVVKEAVDLMTGQACAVKIIKKDIYHNQLNNEIAMLKSLHHKRIVSCVDSFEDHEFHYIVMELMNGGELFDRIVRQGKYTEKRARDNIRMVLEGVKYCHDRNIVHRDLKPDNLLLSSADSDDGLKIADFGTAAICNGDNLTEYCGTLDYLCPEVVRRSVYGKGADMWAVGVILHILLGGNHPFQNRKPSVTKARIQTLEPACDWAGVSSEAKLFVKQLISKCPANRPTVDQALDNPWMHTDDVLLASRSLEATAEAIRVFNVQRRWKRAGNAVRAIGRFQMGLSSKSSDTTSPSSCSTAADSGDTAMDIVTSSSASSSSSSLAVHVSGSGAEPVLITGDDNSTATAAIAAAGTQLQDPTVSANDCADQPVTNYRRCGSLSPDEWYVDDDRDTAEELQAAASVGHVIDEEEPVGSKCIIS